jgi:hypothetical protein
VVGALTLSAKAAATIGASPKLVSNTAMPLRIGRLTDLPLPGSLRLPTTLTEPAPGAGTKSQILLAQEEQQAQRRQHHRREYDAECGPLARGASAVAQTASAAKPLRR